MSFSFYIARRYLRSRRHSFFLSLVSVIAVVGIILGVTVLDLTLAIMNGFHQELRRTFVDNMPMITVLTSDPEGFTDLGAVVDTIGCEPGVVGAAPFVRQEVVLTERSSFGPVRHHGGVVWGIEPVLQESVTPLADRVFPHASALHLLNDPEGTPRIILGIELAASLFAGLGDTVIVTAPAGDIDLQHMEAESRCFVVAGFIETGMYEFDGRFAWISLANARDFFGYGPAGASGIGIKVGDMMAAPEIGRRLEVRLGEDRFHANDWIALNQNLFRWIRIEKVVMFLLLGLVVLVAAFNIIGILTMMVGERSREIGILLSMGARPRQIQGIFITNGLCLGAVGTALGSLLGYLGTVYLERFGFKLPGDVYFLDHVPVVAQAGDFLAVAGVAMVITLLSTLFPSWLGSRLKPMEIIRYT